METRFVLPSRGSGSFGKTWTAKKLHLADCCDLKSYQGKVSLKIARLVPQQLAAHNLHNNCNPISWFRFFTAVVFVVRLQQPGRTRSMRINNNLIQLFSDFPQLVHCPRLSPLLPLKNLTVFCRWTWKVIIECNIFPDN